MSTTIDPHNPTIGLPNQGRGQVKPPERKLSDGVTNEQARDFYQRRLSYSAPQGAPIEDWNGSAFDAFAASVVDGFRTSLGPSIYQGVSYSMYGLSGNKITKDDFEKTFALGGQLKWHDGMTVEQAEYIYRNKVRENSLNFRMQANVAGPGVALAAFAGGFFGNMADPVTIASIAIPGFGAEAITHKLFTSAGKAALGGMTKRQLGKSILRGAVNAEIEAAVFEPFIYSQQSKLQSEYGWKDSAMNLLASPVLGSLIGGASGVVSHRVAKRRNERLRAQFIDAVTGERSMMDTLKSIDPAIERIKELVERIKYMQDIASTGPMTREQANAMFDTIFEFAASADEVASSPSKNPHAEELARLEREHALIESRIDELVTVSKESGGDPRIDEQVSVLRDQLRDVRDRLQNCSGWFNAYERTFNSNPVARGEMRFDAIGKDPSAEPIHPVRRMTLLNRLRDALQASHTARKTDGSLHDGVSENHAHLADVMKNLFNREVRFHSDPERFGRGAAYSKDPGYIFIYKGGSTVQAAQVIGHEFWHTLRVSDPGLWSDMMKFVHDTNPRMFDKYYFKTGRDQSIAFAGSDNHWGKLSVAQRIDEAFAEMLGDAFTDPHFWSSLSKAADQGKVSRSVLNKVLDYVRELYARVSELIARHDLPRQKYLREIHEHMGKILGDRAGTIPKTSVFGRMGDSQALADTLSRHGLTETYSKLVARTQRLDKGIRRSLEPNTVAVRNAFLELAIPEFWSATFRSQGENWTLRRSAKVKDGKTGLQYLSGIYYNKFRHGSHNWTEFPVLYIGDPRTGGKPVDNTNAHQATHVAFFSHEGGFPSTTEHRGGESADRYRADDQLLQELRSPVTERELDDLVQETGNDLDWWLKADHEKELGIVIRMMADPETPAHERKRLEHSRRLHEYLSENAGDSRELIFEYYRDAILAKRDSLAAKQLQLTQDPTRAVESFFGFDDLQMEDSNAYKERNAKQSPEILAREFSKHINQLLSDKKFSTSFINSSGPQSLGYMFLSMLAEHADKNPDGSVRIASSFFEDGLLDNETGFGRYLKYQKAISQKFEKIDQIMAYLENFTNANSEELASTAWTAAMDNAADDVLALGHEIQMHKERMAELEQAFDNGEFPDPIEMASEDIAYRPDDTIPYRNRLTKYAAGLVNSTHHVQDRLVEMAKAMNGRQKAIAKKLDTHFTDLRTKTDLLFKEKGGFSEAVDHAKTIYSNKVNAVPGQVKSPNPPAPAINADTAHHLDAYVGAYNKRILSEAVIDEMFQLDAKGNPVIDFNQKNAVKALIEFKAFMTWVHAKMTPAEPLMRQVGGALGAYDAGSMDVKIHLNERTMQAMWRKARSLAEAHVPNQDIKARLLEDVKSIEAITVMRERAQRAAENRWAHEAHKGYKHVMTAIDGEMRRGTDRSIGVETQININTARDVQPFLHTLISEGVADKWMSGDYTEAVMAHLEGKTSNDPIVVKLADSLRDSYKAIAYRMNQAGAAIHFRDDFSIRHIHNAALLRKAGLDEWINDTLKWLDVPATMRKLAGMSEAKLQADGSVVFQPIISIQGYLEQVYQDIISEHPREMLANMSDTDLFEHGGNLAGRYDHGRKLQFRPGEYYNYLKKYGNPNPHHEVFQQLQSLSEAATLMGEFGPNYAKTSERVMRTLPQSGADKRQQFTAKVTLQKILGELDHPKEQALAEGAQFLRALANGAFLGTSGISSMMDIATSFSRMRYMGMSYGDMFKGYFKAMAEAIKRDRTSPEAAWFLGQGAGFQAMLGSVSRRLTGEMPGSNAARRINDWVFKWNGMNFWNRVAQEAIVDVTTQHLAKQAQIVRSGGSITPEFAQALAKFGIDVNEFAVLSRFAGQERFTADMIPEDLSIGADKLRHFINDTMNEAVLMPTASEEALLVLGTKAGTVEGEAIRTIMQYRTFPFALMRKTYRRLINTIGENAGESWSKRFFNKSAVDMYAFLATSFFMGWVTLNVKEMLKGREPLHFTDSDQYRMANVGRIIKASGTLGIINDITAADAMDLLGPLLGKVQETADSKDAYGVASGVSEMLPGSSLPGISTVRKAIISEMFGAAGEMHINATSRMMKAKYGQDPLLP